MAIDWETATDKDQLGAVSLWIYRLLNMVRVTTVPESSESHYKTGPLRGSVVFENYCCIPANKDNDKRIREIADEWKASGLFFKLPLFGAEDDLGWFPLMGSIEEGDDG